MHLRIIILEDTPSEFMQTKHALEQYADLYHHTFEIVWVQNESSLIRMYHAQSFDLLFADIEIKLPNTSSSENGIIICKKLRELQYSGDIIFLTNFQEYVFEGYFLSEIERAIYLQYKICDNEQSLMKAYSLFHLMIYVRCICCLLLQLMYCFFLLIC